MLHPIRTIQTRKRAVFRKTKTKQRGKKTQYDRGMKMVGQREAYDKKGM